MTEFFINHTRKVIIRAEADAGFNITKNLRYMIDKYLWSLDDHIEFIHSDRISHVYGVKLIITWKYTLENWQKNLQFLMNRGTPEYMAITLDEYAGPFGV
jgi:hypothetical protein